MQSSRFTVIPELHAAGDPAAAGIRVPFVRPALPSWETIGPMAAEILASGRLTKGPLIERLESAIAARVGVRHAIALSSCTIDPSRFGMTRDTMRRALAERGIETRTYYDPPCHRQTVFEHFHDRSRPLPGTELLSGRSLSLPIGGHVDEAVVAEVCEAIATAKNA